MAQHEQTCYPFVWFDGDGWWFKVFDACFGPYDRPEDARHNLLVIQCLSRQLHNVPIRASSFPDPVTV